MESKRILVVGSGPAGVSAAKALLDRGELVTLLDPGQRVERDTQSFLSQLSSQPPENWPSSIVESLLARIDFKGDGVPQKRFFGSDYMYRHSDQVMRIQRNNTPLQGSFAEGGFSSVWGAAVLPFREKDITDWPIRAEQLHPHYASIEKWIGVSGEADDLAAHFPIYSSNSSALPLSRQGEYLRRHLEHHKAILNADNIYFGKSRLAVDIRNVSCTRCSLCLFGCPYGIIYNSSRSIEQLKKNYPQFEHKSGFVLETFLEKDDRIVGQFLDLNSNQKVELSGRALFLGSGSVHSTAILMRSLGIRDQPIELKDSQYFLLPALMKQSFSNLRSERLHTLSQLFVEILDDEEVLRESIHMQVYTFNSLYERAIEAKFGRVIFPALRPFANFLLSRLISIQGYLPSSHSGTLRFELDQSGNVSLRPSSNLVAKELLNRVIKKVSKHSKHLGFHLIPGVSTLGTPGRGFHVGGSFPMSKNPGIGETDTLGRPADHRRVFVIDSTIFPSIPATTITFSIMANAHRIGTEAELL